MLQITDVFQNGMWLRFHTFRRFGIHFSTAKATEMCFDTTAVCKEKFWDKLLKHFPASQSLFMASATALLVPYQSLTLSAQQKVISIKVSCIKRPKKLNSHYKRIFDHIVTDDHW